MPRIVISDGPRAGKEHQLGRETTVGNSSVNDIVVQGPDVADIQARFVEDGDAYYLENSGGSDVVRINGEPVETRTQLKREDKIVIGGITLLFNPYDAETREGLENLMGGPKRPTLGIVLPLLAAVVILETFWAIGHAKAAGVGGIVAAALLAGYLVKIAFERKGAS